MSPSSNDESQSPREAQNHIFPDLDDPEMAQSSEDLWESMSEDFADMNLTPEDLAAIDAQSHIVKQPENRVVPAGPKTLEETFIEATRQATKFEPHPWQVGVACALYRGQKDVLLIAGTGYGKTLPFVMPCFVRPETLVWIVSPLNYIEMEQAKKFRDWGLRAIAVNSVTSYPNMLEDVKKGRYQVVLSSIESMMASNKLRPALGSNKLSKRPHILVVDEAHAMTSWSETGFRPLYANTGRLRRILPPNTPVIAATATANKEIRTNIQKTLAFRNGSLETILGNFRHNIIFIVHFLKGSAGAVDEIHQYVLSGTKPVPTLVFVDSRALGQIVLNSLRKHVDPSNRYRIQLYHAFRSDLAKKVLAEGFKLGIFWILICTESLTMGADFQNIGLVINFLTPDSLLTWLQRAGRGARLADIVCRAILMVQPSVAKLVGKLKAEEARKRQEEQTTRPLAEEPSEISSTAEDVAGVSDNDSEPGEDDEGNEVTPLEEDNRAAGGEAEAYEPVRDDEDDGRDEIEDNLDEEDEVAEVSETSPAAAKSVQRRRKTYTRALLNFIGHTGCRIAYLDAEYDNPSRSTNVPCTLCDNCLAKQSVQSLNQDVPVQVVPMAEDPVASSASKRITWLRPAERATCEDALREWRRRKRRTDEDLKDTDIPETYILPDKTLTSIARHPRLLFISDFENISPKWPHYRRWGQEVIAIVKYEQEKRWKQKVRAQYGPVAKKAAKEGKKDLARREKLAKVALRAEQLRKSAEERKEKARIKQENQPARTRATKTRSSAPTNPESPRVKSEPDSAAGGSEAVAVKQESIEGALNATPKGKRGNKTAQKATNSPITKSEALDQYTIKIKAPKAPRRSFPS